MKKYTTDINEMLADGYSRKFADYYLAQVTKERKLTAYDQSYVQWAHNHGFCAESACSYKLNESNVGDYLSDYDYYKVWPLNDWSRIWINDKLTLKYMLGASEYGSLMPKYYFYSTQKGLRALVDNPCKEGTLTNF